MPRDELAGFRSEATEFSYFQTQNRFGIQQVSTENYPKALFSKMSWISGSSSKCEFCTSLFVQDHSISSCLSAR
ncbi:hypothetical protein M8J77_016255 [Diaphorina citri]|nr:hypothetical protein M8J77_016255 [Diaphorina citri]